jgi:hypothetical protein
MFFFEKKNQKTFSLWFRARPSKYSSGSNSAGAKVFWFFFSKKNTSFFACFAILSAAHAAPPSAAVQLVAKNSYPFTLTDNRLAGPGADFLRRATAGAQFVLAGETHHDHFTPLFDLALLDLLHRDHGFNQVVVEQDPLGIEAILQPKLRGDAVAIGHFLPSYPTLLGFASDEDLQFLAGASRLIPGPQPIWGIEQAQSPARYLELLAPLAPDAASRRLDETLLADARKAEPTRGDFGKFLALNPTTLGRLQALAAAYHKPPDTRAATLLTGLVKSAEIYSYYRRASAGEPVGLYNNTVREAWLKAGFIAHYRQVGSTKALFKFGANHMIRGLNFTGAFSLSTFLHEFAIYNGTQAYGINVVTLGGYNAASDLTWMKNLRAALPPGPVVIDAEQLRPQWKKLADGLPPDDRATLQQMIFGFESIVFFGNSQKATWSLTGFPVP